MKKIIGTIFTVLTVFILSACSSSIHENLQSQNWNVVSTNGESYTANFAQDTVTFDLQIASLGFNYDVNEEGEQATITMTQQDSSEGELVFNINQNEDEYQFIAQNEEVKDQYGDLTLSPMQNENGNQ